MEFDRSDILGQDTMPIAQDSNFHVARDSNWSSGLFSAKNLVLVFVGLFFTYTVGRRLWRRFLLWRERSYKLATRRRHGIPDDDLRPFNVAYTDAVMRVREEEMKKQAKSRPPIERLPVEAASVTQFEAVSAHNLRQRPVSQFTDAAPRSTPVAVPGGYNSRSTESMLPPTPRSSDDRLPNGYFSHVQQPSLNLDRPSIYAEGSDGQSDNEVKKRSRHMEQDEEHEVKRTRDEDAEFEEGVPRRGYKRVIQEEAEDSDAATETKRSRGKRARKLSTERPPQAHQPAQYMDIDDEDMDDITELKPVSRGKKRDRAEAGSTFAGDDDESALENEEDGDSKLRRRRRKRRTVAKRKSEATHHRGKKRERENDEDVSDDSSDETSPSKVSASRRKRGRRSTTVLEMQRRKSDVSMDDSITSSRRLREIGEEWESNGVTYKIGPNGQRLRQALVKKARQKFLMPKDSQHPDRSANMQVCIESWLTEEEYQQAKADHLLAWQDSPKRSEDVEKLFLDITSQGIPFPPSVPGKNLLWTGSTSSTPTMSPASHSPSEFPSEIPLPRRGSSYRHSIGTSVAVPITSFGSSTSTLTASKRISSTSRALSLTGSTNSPLASSVNATDSPDTPGLSESTNGTQRTPAPAKVFSKWEKQELEARAIMKVREANRKREMEKENKEREEREARERVAAAERARLEKERQDKERQEKERQERQRQEKERSEKEAADRDKKEMDTGTGSESVPTITVISPSTGPATPALKPNNFFSLPKTPETTSAVPNFFNKPAKPMNTGFGVTAGTSSEDPAMTTTTTTPAAPATSQLPFSFANPSAATSEQKKDDSGSTTAGSTGLGTQPQAPAPSNPFMSYVKTEGSTTAPVNPFLAFAKTQPSPAATATPVNAFPSAAPATATTSATTAGTTSASTTGTTPAPKFTFNFKPTSTPAATMSPPAASMTTTTPAEKKEPPTFSFKPPAPSGAAPSTGTASSSVAGSRAAPKFTFGVTSAPGASRAAAASAAASSPFSLNNASAGSVFGTGTPSGATSSTFGTNTTPVGNTGSAFGTTSTPGGTTGSAFGTPSTPAGSTGSAFGTTTTPLGTGSAFGTTTTPAGPTGSAFGATTTPLGTTASAYGATTTPAGTTGSAFGTTTTPATGVFGTTTTPGGTTGSAFGTTTTPAGTTGSAFGTATTPAGSTGSAFGGTGAVFLKPSVFGTAPAAFGKPPFRRTAASASTNNSNPLNPFSNATTSSGTTAESHSFGSSATPTPSSPAGNPFGTTTPSTTPGVFSFKPSIPPQPSPFSTAESSNTTSTAPTAPTFNFSASGSQEK